jgi:hypothetical protein
LNIQFFQFFYKKQGNSTFYLTDTKRRKKRALRAANLPEEIRLIEVDNPKLSTDLLMLEREEINMQRCYKFGVLLAMDNQTEDEMFSNGNTSIFLSFFFASNLNPFPFRINDQSFLSFCSIY